MRGEEARHCESILVLAQERQINRSVVRVQMLFHALPLWGGVTSVILFVVDVRTEGVELHQL